MAALDVLVDENLSQRSNELGALLRSTLKAAKLPHVAGFDGRPFYVPCSGRKATENDAEEDSFIIGSERSISQCCGAKKNSDLSSVDDQ